MQDGSTQGTIFEELFSRIGTTFSPFPVVPRRILPPLSGAAVDCRWNKTARKLDLQNWWTSRDQSRRVGRGVDGRGPPPHRPPSSAACR